jgi:hypothetical protein
MSPGCVGCHPSRSRVSVLETGLSAARKPARKPKCSLASSAGTETAGTSRCRPITSAMARIGTPSSATACSGDPAGAFSRAGYRHTDRLSSRNALLPLLRPRRPGHVPTGRAPARRHRDYRARRHNRPAAYSSAAVRARTSKAGRVCATQRGEHGVLHRVQLGPQRAAFQSAYLCAPPLLTGSAQPAPSSLS